MTEIEIVAWIKKLMKKPNKTEVELRTLGEAYAKHMRMITDSLANRTPEIVENVVTPTTDIFCTSL